MGCCATSNNEGTKTSDNAQGGGTDYKNDPVKNLDGKTGKIKVTVDKEDKSLYLSAGPSVLQPIKITNERLNLAILSIFKKNNFKDGYVYRLPKPVPVNVLTDDSSKYDDVEQQPGQPGQAAYGGDEHEQVLMIMSAMSGDTEVEIEFVTTVGGQSYGIDDGRVGESKHLKATDSASGATVTFRFDSSDSLWLMTVDKTVTVDGVDYTTPWCICGYSDGDVMCNITHDTATAATDTSSSAYQSPRWRLPIHSDVGGSSSLNVMQAMSRIDDPDDKHFMKINSNDKFKCHAKATAARVVTFELVVTA